MIGAAKKQSSLLPGLAALRLVLLLVVAFCLPETRVWGFAITPQPASSVFESASPSSIGEFTTAIGYDASGSPVAARGAETAADLAKVGRSGKQARLRELGSDPKVSSADRGWIQQEINSIERGQRTNIRVPPGKNLAHRRGFEAKKGYSYEHSDLQDIDLHKLQHKHEGY